MIGRSMDGSSFLFSISPFKKYENYGRKEKV